MRQSGIPGKMIIAVLVCFVTATGVATINACKKSKPATQTVENKPITATTIATSKYPAQTKIVSVANIRKSAAYTGSDVFFCQLAQIFRVTDPAILAGLQSALDNNRKIQITFDPWNAAVQQIAEVPVGAAQRGVSDIISSPSTAVTIDLAHSTADFVNNLPGLAVLNTTGSGLTNVVPDFATAQLMFDYISHQCCALSGPFGIDYCLSFQYCQDGCYARAHKMCYIINNRFHYDTHKIFSFANSGSDELSVQAQKWGGCCINWWYHVAPLVNIKTPSGTKAYVFDPAMFDQPVLLATWLHAQENPACSTTPHVSMINIQPNASYGPASLSGMTFYPDPLYADSDTTMVHYRDLISCP